MATTHHWREYALEAALLGSFMVSAVVATAVVQHPSSPVRQAVGDPLIRRALIGLAMGLTAAAIFYSPWGQRSGAHLNPAVTLSFLRLGKVAPRLAGGYVVGQFAGGIAGLLLATAAVREVAGHPAVNYVATVPGPAGLAAAAAGELAIAFGMMTAVLIVSNTPRLARFTGAVAATLVALYITFESPLSGMSMNPARSFGPALAAGTLDSLWIYFAAPPAGMLLAAEAYVRTFGRHTVRCAKIHHPRTGPCQFNCGFKHEAASFQLPASSSQLPASSSQLSAPSFQLSALSSQLSALSSQLSALSSQLSALSPERSGTRHRAPSTQHPAPSTKHSALSTQHPAPSTQHSAPSTQHSAPSTQHSAPSTQHPAREKGSYARQI